MNSLITHLQDLITKTESHNKSWKPLFFRIQNLEDKTRFLKLLETPGIIVSDTLFGQVKELIKIKNPTKKFNDEEYSAEVLKHIFPVSIQEYGVWVYYPWSNRLIHIPDEMEFIEIRTSRNQYKITKEERDYLNTKKIGIIGLSVGQSVSLTLALERIGGELRLADFDTLELNNLNRIRTPLYNITLPKVYAVAREIAEIDPYLNIKCFEDGVNEDNLHQFFTEGGKLDLLIEESDGFDIKIISRYKAKELRIPVLMETSDKCMVDVERFDLEPDLDILYGKVKHLDIKTLKNLKTTEEKTPYILDILGIDDCSVRLKASMFEIEQTINTWPQLGSAVTMGGGITTDVSRRILLNTYTDSGRYRIDIEALIGNKETTIAAPEEELKTPGLERKEIERIINREPEIKVNDIASNKLIVDWIKNAIKAPSAGNNQPWKWYLDNNILYLFHDRQKSAGWDDPFDNLAHLSLGAAIENLKISALHNKYSTIVDYYPIKEEPTCIARISFEAGINEKDFALNEELFNTISTRCTNRKKGTIEKIDSEILASISFASGPGNNVAIIENTTDIALVAEIVSLIEKFRFLDPNGHHDFFNKEIRWTEEETNRTRDGLDVDTFEVTLAGKMGLKLASDPEVIAKIREWKGGNGFQKISRESIITSSAIGLLQIETPETAIYIKGGEAMQRVWLTANHFGIALHPISAPLFFFDRIAKIKDLPDEIITEIKKQEVKFNAIFPHDVNKTNIFLFRLSIADPPTKVSLRRNLEDSLYIK
ncbi:MAG TPA: Rv1355c family protein [Saprospiraceae bacterium]|nr:Rv1355c family protein [Saprospiraceae bacterium]